MSIVAERDYQRKHLRAPYKEPILYVDDDFVFKAHTLNISEGGVLLDQIPHFPEKDIEVPLMIALPQFPYFKNFSLEKLHEFSSDIFPKKVVRLKCKVVRKIGIKSKVDEAFVSRVAVSFTEISPPAKKIIKEYVDVFASNLIYLQVLIDNIHTEEKNLEKIRTLANILHYDAEMKIAQLRKDVQHDYISLQWL